jgi:hypothetical protein
MGGTFASEEFILECWELKSRKEEDQSDQSAEKKQGRFLKNRTNPVDSLKNLSAIIP